MQKIIHKVRKNCKRNLLSSLVYFMTAIRRLGMKSPNNFKGFYGQGTSWDFLYCTLLELTNKRADHLLLIPTSVITDLKVNKLSKLLSIVFDRRNQKNSRRIFPAQGQIPRSLVTSHLNINTTHTHGN